MTGTRPTLAAARRMASSDDQVVVGSIWMLASTAAVSLGSFVFWLIAAHQADIDAVGRATALFSSVFFLSYATNLGLPVALGRFAAGSGRVDAQRFRLALEASIVAALTGATIFVLIDPSDLLEPVQRWGRLIGWVVIGLLTVGVAVSVLVDVRLMGLRRWKDVFMRSAAIAVVRLPPLLWAVSDDSGFWIFAVAVGGYAITALPYLRRGLIGAGQPERTWAAHGEAIEYSGVNYLSQLAVQAPLFVTPLVVALVVDSDDNATFYLSWGIMTVVYVGIHLLGRTLLVEGSRADSHLISQARRTLGLALAVATLAAVVSVPAGPVVEALYGGEHDDMSVVLPLLMAGLVPWAFTRTCLAIARCRSATGENLLVAGWSAVTVLAGVAIGGLAGGSIAAAVGWAIGSVASLIVSLPILRRQLRGVA